MELNLDLCVTIRELIIDRLSLEDISADTDLLKEGVLDSVTLVQLIMLLEERFGVRIDLSELEIDDLRSVRSIAALITKLQSAGVGDDDLELTHAAIGSAR